MRILQIVGAFPPAFVHGGPVYTTFHLSKALIELGHEVFVLTTDICGTERLNVPTSDTVWKGVPVRYCHWKRSLIPYHSPDLAEQVQLRGRDFDVALISSSWTGYGVMAGRVCRQIQLPYIMYAHGSYSPLRLRKSYSKKKLWWKLFDRSLYNGAASVVALTKAEVGEVRAMGVKVPIWHIPNGVNPIELMEPRDRNWLEETVPALTGKPYVLFLGRIDPIKGLDLLVNAFAHLAPRSPNATLVLAGPDERGYRAEVERLVSQCGINHRVLFLGMVTGELKTALFRHAELFSLTSRGEGMSISVLEAMAAATPVLLTHECNMPEVEQADAGIVTEQSVEDVAAGIEVVLADRARRLRMGHNAKALIISRYTWSSIAQQTVAVLEKVLN